VGEWRGTPPLEPTEKLLMALESKRSPNVVNYPHGFISSAGEILPINANFVKKLLKPLLDRGFEVNVIPISYEVDSHLISQSRSVDKINVTAKFHQPLMHSAVKVLVAKQLESGTRYFDHFLTSLWFDNITAFPELTLNQLLDRAENNLGIKLEGHKF
jgi:hypothetical protein